MIEKTVGFLAAALLPLAFASNAQAMGMVRVGDTMVMNGRVFAEDLQQFKEKLAQGPLKRVILLDSQGGSTSAAYGIARLLMQQQIDTAVAGDCISSCAIIFMAGHERQMVDGKTLAATRLGFHAPHNTGTNLVTSKGAEQLQAYLLRTSGGKFNAELLERAMKISDAGDLLYFYYPTEDDSKASVQFCNSAMVSRSFCKKIPGYDALSAGILTTRNLLATSTEVSGSVPPSPAQDASDTPAAAAEK